MKLYLDTGNVEEIREAVSSGILDGVTTNPTLIAREGRQFEDVVKEIVEIFREQGRDFTVSCEVTNASNFDGIVREGRELAKIDEHVLVKVPLTFDGLKAVSVLSKEGVRCNVTLCFSANQALLAAKAGAFCVSPFVGRVNDEGFSGVDLVSDIRKIYDNYGFKTRILAASVRGANDVLECAKIGADIATVPFKVFKKLYYNPLTDIGIEKFDADWKDYQGKLK